MDFLTVMNTDDQENITGISLLQPAHMWYKNLQRVRPSNFDDKVQRN